MKNKLIDIADMVEKLIRAGFFLGAGSFLAIKALIVIPQNSGIPDWLESPAFLIAIVGGFIMAMKVFYEPTPKQRREAKEREKMFYQWLEEIEEKREIRR